VYNLLAFYSSTNQEVARLDVTMCDASVVHVLRAIEEIRAEALEHPQWRPQAFLSREEAAEVFACQA
jgi:hypothetical protein